MMAVLERKRTTYTEENKKENAAAAAAKSHQAPLSLGFSKQEHRSGLPFSSPMHESEK